MGLSSHAPALALSHCPSKIPSSRCHLLWCQWSDLKNYWRSDGLASVRCSMHWEHIDALRSRNRGDHSDRLHSDHVETMKQTCTTSARDRHRHLRGSMAERTYHYSENLS